MLLGMLVGFLVAVAAGLPLFPLLVWYAVLQCAAAWALTRDPRCLRAGLPIVIGAPLLLIADDLALTNSWPWLPSVARWLVGVASIVGLATSTLFALTAPTKGARKRQRVIGKWI